jgi:hypothetical protein
MKLGEIKCFMGGDGEIQVVEYGNSMYIPGQHVHNEDTCFSFACYRAVRVMAPELLKLDRGTIIVIEAHSERVPGARSVSIRLADTDTRKLSDIRPYMDTILVDGVSSKEFSSTYSAFARFVRNVADDHDTIYLVVA